MISPPPPLYKAWTTMLQRCYNPKDPKYKSYGKRGIKVCPQWHDFKTFIKDMGPRPEGYSIERIDNDRDYEPPNCKWASRKEQQRNRRNTLRLTYNGITKSSRDWAEELGIQPCTLYFRITKYGWDVEKALDPSLRRGIKKGVPGTKRVYN